MLPPTLGARVVVQPHACLNVCVFGYTQVPPPFPRTLTPPLFCQKSCPRLQSPIFITKVQHVHPIIFSTNLFSSIFVDRDSLVTARGRTGFLLLRDDDADCFLSKVAVRLRSCNALTAPLVCLCHEDHPGMRQLDGGCVQLDFRVVSGTPH